jgi:hypothetical protein
MSVSRIISALIDVFKAISCKIKIKCCNSECSSEPNNGDSESDRLEKHTSNRLDDVFEEPSV